MSICRAAWGRCPPHAARTCRRTRTPCQPSAARAVLAAAVALGWAAEPAVRAAKAAAAAPAAELAGRAASAASAATAAAQKLGTHMGSPPNRSALARCCTSACPAGTAGMSCRTPRFRTRCPNRRRNVGPHARPPQSQGYTQAAAQRAHEERTAPRPARRPLTRAAASASCAADESRTTLPPVAAARAEMGAHYARACEQEAAAARSGER
jgi:hypothetical protein